MKEKYVAKSHVLAGLWLAASVMIVPAVAEVQEAAEAAPVPRATPAAGQENAVTPAAGQENAVTPADGETETTTADGEQPAAAAAKAVTKTAVKKPAAKRPPGLRSWKAVNGDVVEAFYEDMDGGVVSLKTPEGQIFKIPLRNLGQADQQWILVNKGEGTGAVNTPDSPDRLPSFADGKWKGMHAVYEHRRFDALMNDKGIIMVYPKDDKGKRGDKALRFALSCYYNNTLFNPSRHTARAVKEFKSPPSPQRQGKEVSFGGLLVDDVPFEVTFSFKDNKIEGYGWLKDPAAIRDRTIFRIGVNVPASHDLGMAKMPEREAVLKGFEVHIRPEKGNSTVYPYANSLQHMSGIAKTVAIVGPVFGTRKVSVATGNVDEAPLRPYIYPGNAPWQGYYVGMYKKAPDSKARSERITLAVE